MHCLHLRTILAVVLFFNVVVPQRPYPSFPHQHRPLRHRGSSYGFERTYGSAYNSRHIASLIGKPAKVVKIVKVSLPSNNYRPYGQGNSGAGSGSQHTFGVSRVPASSFVDPSSSRLPGNTFGVTGPASGVIGSHTSSVGTGSIQRPSNFGVPTPENNFGSSEVFGPSLVDRVDVRLGPTGTSSSGGGGMCPPVRPLCTSFRTSPPTCTTDATCPRGQKCCFDTCVQRNICKSVV